MDLPPAQFVKDEMQNRGLIVNGLIPFYHSSKNVETTILQELYSQQLYLQQFYLQTIIFTTIVSTTIVFTTNCIYSKDQQQACINFNQKLRSCTSSEN